MRKRWLLALLILLVAGGIWFWFLGALPDEPAAQAVLSEVSGIVSVKAPGASDFTLVRSGQAVAEGSVIRTAADASAVADWFGAGESVIAAFSEVTVIRASVGEEGSLRLRLRLEAGRVWSRVGRLLDPEGDVSVETSDVVATVRGTSFDLEKRPGQPTTLRVADSVVEASGATVGNVQDGFFVPAGSMASFGGPDRATRPPPISTGDRESAWFMKNSEADTPFEKKTFDRLQASLAADRLPESGWLRDLALGSQALHLRLTPAARRPELATRYFLRRLMVIRRTVEEGKSGLASQELARIDIVPEDRKAVLQAQRLFRDVGPDQGAYRIKQQVEEWLPLVARNQAERIFSRLFVISLRLDEAMSAFTLGKTDQAKQMLVLSRQGLANVEREARDAKDVEPATRVRLRHHWKALSVRADALDAAFAAALLPLPALPALPPASPTSTSNLPVPTSTPPAPPVATSTVPAAKPVPTSLLISPVGSTIAFFQSVTYRAIVVYDTGLTRDVTKLTRFLVTPSGYGALNGNVFTATQLQGSLTMTATYTEDGKTVDGRTSLTVVDRLP